MNITFREARDLGRHGRVAAGETRSDLPDDYAASQVAYGFAYEEQATPTTKKRNQED